jgi:type II secretory pathway component GspD/PulD (secretin)
MTLFPLTLTIACLSAPGVASLTGQVFRPHDAESRRALDELRDLVEPLKGLQPDAPRASNNIKRRIDLEVRVLSVSITDAGTSFFANARNDQLVPGRLKQRQPESFVRALRKAGVELVSRPRLRTTSGQRASLDLSPRPCGGGSNLNWHILWPSWGTLIQITPSSYDDDQVILQLSVALCNEKPGTMRTEASGPKYEWTASGTTRASIQWGDTLVVGGLKHKRPEAHSMDIPLLNLLPEVGHRFWLGYHTWVEEELVVVVTPVFVRPEQKEDQE